MNDLHLLDLQTNEWVTVALFGEHLPQQRWGHSMVASNTKLLIFGGMDLTQFSETAIY